MTNPTDEELDAAVAGFDAKWIPVTESGCWIWIGCGTRGYGTFWFEGRMQYAHRVSYQIHRGQIPPRLVIDHLCKVLCCVNPWHLEVVTQRENVIRGRGPDKLLEWKRAITHCQHGHEYTEENTYIHDNKRYCRACGKRKSREYRERKSNCQIHAVVNQ